jgi:hypothetical protein
MREVKAKRKRWREERTTKGAEFLGKHMIPVILGPKQRHYVIDHHHLALALHGEGVKDILVTIVANLSKLEKDAFWVVLDNRSWMHPFDDQGRRRDYADIPKAVSDLVDDPFRSLAGELRRAGGYAKDTTPFSEFLWADFLRRRNKRQDVENDFDGALEEALKLAKGTDSDYLPGWRGPVTEFATARHRPMSIDAFWAPCKSCAIARWIRRIFGRGSFTASRSCPCRSLCFG